MQRSCGPGGCADVDVSVQKLTGGSQRDRGGRKYAACSLWQIAATEGDNATKSRGAWRNGRAGNSQLIVGALSRSDSVSVIAGNKRVEAKIGNAGASQRE